MSVPMVVATLLIGYVASLIIYRRFFHPLAKVPGPFLPAVTNLCSLYYFERYYKKVDEYHQKYGPIVRINPNEVHLSDPEDFDRIYSTGSGFYKSPVFYGAFCIPNSSFATPSEALHRRKRARLNPFFSRRMTLNLEEVVQEKAHKIVKIMQKAIVARQPVYLDYVFRSLSVDVASDYAFNKCYDLLESPDLGKNFIETVKGVAPATHVFQAFPILPKVATRLPLWLIPYLSSPLNYVITLQIQCVQQIEDVKQRIRQGKLSTKRPTVFSELLDPAKYPNNQVPTTLELKDEAYSVLAAASDTTGNTLAAGAYHIMDNPEIYKKLRTELLATFPDPNAHLDYLTLEKLPYLTAVIKEALRLSYPVISRLARITPEPGATFQGYFIPAGTQVGMSCYQQHRNTDFFPDPDKFDPERWLDPEAFRRLERQIMPFGGGSRQCIGMPLAYCELYVTLGTFFHRFGNLKVYDTPKSEYFDYDDFFVSSSHGKPFRAIGHEE